MNPNPTSRSHELLSCVNSRLLVIDMQEKLLPHIDGATGVTERCRQLIIGAETFNVPITVTEQYPKGLGPTTADLSPHLPPRIEKLTFSAMPALDWNREDADVDDRFQVVVCGVESHVCVLQTAFDLMANGYRVYLPADAVGSRHTLDREKAIERLSSAGATICTTESVLFEWCEVAGTDEFKAISKLVK